MTRCPRHPPALVRVEGNKQVNPCPRHPPALVLISFLSRSFSFVTSLSLINIIYFHAHLHTLIHYILISISLLVASSSLQFTTLSFNPIVTRAMYPHCNTKFSRAADFLVHWPSPDTHLPSAPPMRSTACLHQLDSQIKSELSHHSCTSGCSSYGSPGSLASYGAQRPSLIQRSISSHSLQKNGVDHHPVSALFSEFLLASEKGPVRRVYSTGDLQRINVMRQNRQSESTLSSESSMIIEGILNRACPYSPEEKKVRIERYRSKKHQRNFNKKIKYACRKILADSRPRIRGRFARNEEINKNPPVQWSHSGNGGEEEEEEEKDEKWVNSLIR